MLTKETKKNRRKLPATKAAVALIVAALMIMALAGCAVSTSTDGTSSDSTETASTGSGMIFSVVYIVVIVAVFYFILIRPENKRKKKAEEMRSNISIGDTITTIGGIVGKVVNVSDEYITFETGEDRVRLKITKWGVSSTGKDTEEPDDKVPENK